MVRKIYESAFLINIFENINITHIFYKSSQSCDNTLTTIII
jgi:hypothetical protein